MLKTTNYFPKIKHFVIFITFLSFLSCSQQQFIVKKIEGKKVNINTSIATNTPIETYITPYKARLDADMNTILSNATITYDKQGQWETPMGKLLANATLKQGNIIFNKRENKNIDIVLLNHGGIRANINKGDVTTRTAFEVMPFENSMIIVALKGEVVHEMINNFIADKKPHPLAGLTFVISKNNIATNILVNGIALDFEKTYYVATSDYLSNGGDKMDFFKKGTQFIDVDYKLRNVLIDFFKTEPILPIATNNNISLE